MSGSHVNRTIALVLTAALCSIADCRRADASTEGELVESLLRRRADAFVTAINTPGLGGLETFAREHLGSSVTREHKERRFAEAVKEDFEQMGPIEKHVTRALNKGTLLFVFCKRAATGAWQNYQFRVLSDDGHRLQLVFVANAVEPEEVPATPIQAAETRAWLERHRVRVEEQHPFSGVVVVRSGNQEVYSLVKGLADASEKRPVQRSSRFNMASGSKMFTAVAILQPEQTGRLSLNDTLIKHLPAFPDPRFASRATIHQLLTHTAGAGDYWDETYEKAWGSIAELPQLLPSVTRHLAESPAGEFSYSNSGYVLLGLVIESVSGMNYYDYVRKQIFVPAGMKDTGYPIRPSEEADSAHPYEPEMQAGAVKPGSYVPAKVGARGSSAGGASTTTDDMV